MKGHVNYFDETITYELPDGKWLKLGIREIQKLGLANIMKSYGVEFHSERVPVIRDGRRIGTLPSDFDPIWARSNSFLYDPRPEDFVYKDGAWIVGKTMGACDVDCVVGFVRDEAS